MSLIVAEKLMLGYNGHIVAEDLNFKVNKGDYLCVVGENGSGKTTLIKTILDLQKPVGGKLEFSSDFLRKKIGYLPQQIDLNTGFPATIREIVMSGFISVSGLRPFYSKEEKQEAMINMKRMGIDTIADYSFQNLSGGQRQRVLLARALCAAESLLILDEPVSGLDPDATAEMYELINKLNNDGMTIIMISHDVETALKYASHILHIGNTNFYGNKQEYLKVYDSHLQTMKEDNINA